MAAETDSTPLAPLIAVLNDNQDFLELMRIVLTEEAHYRVITLIANENGYEMVVREKPDLVILDMRIQTPDEGMKILELLLLNPDTARIPVIFCSADVRMMRQKHQFLLSKGCLLLEKPFDVADLYSAVSEALSQVRETMPGEHAGATMQRAYSFRGSSRALQERSVTAHHRSIAAINRSAAAQEHNMAVREMAIKAYMRTMAAIDAAEARMAHNGNSSDADPASSAEP